MIYTGTWVIETLGIAAGIAELRFAEVGTDTRALTDRSLFVALRGERYDGHAFLGAAREAGAVAAVVLRGTPTIAGFPFFEVDDTLRAYALLARARRRMIPGPVVGLTGTNAKTTTKELLAAVVGTAHRTHKTTANDNNLVGVPKTILSSPDDTEALVIEAGANALGEIRRHREVIEPDIAVVTNVSAGHLAGFGSTEAVLQEKLDFVEGVRAVVVGAEPPSLAEHARRRTTGRVLSAGLGAVDVTPDSVRLTESGRPVVTLRGREVRLPLIGRHQATNATIAWTVGELLGLDPAAMAEAMEQVRVPGGRGEIMSLGELTILNDCYNANPASFDAVITLADELRHGRRLVFVAGTMREMGETSEYWHREVATKLLALAPDLLVAVGEFGWVLEESRDELGERLLVAPDAETAGRLLADRLRGDELIVLKASRGVALERILPALTDRMAPASEA